jgi:hypothetical protein
MTTTTKTDQQDAEEEVTKNPPDLKQLESVQSHNKMLDKQVSIDMTIDDEEIVPDDEENLFIELEHVQEKEEEEEALHPHAQPKDVTEAPRLLQEALKKGEVKADDSEEEENNGSQKKISVKNENGESFDAPDIERETTKSDELGHQHHRVSYSMIAIM